jgi:trehalose synthase
VALRVARSVFKNRRIWNVNSTATGGGVVELLHALLPYAIGAGVDTRWLVIQAEPEFFQFTKRLHNLLHGQPSGGGEVTEAERALYERALQRNAVELLQEVSPEDIVILHDPQPAGLVPAVRRKGATVVWRCHIGADQPNDVVRGACTFLRPYVEPANAYIFSRAAYRWDVLDPAKTVVIPPGIDAFSLKNQDLDAESVMAILTAGGIVEGTPPVAGFRRSDGSQGRVVHRARLLHAAPAPSARLVVQVSRWDRLKDPAGVLDGFARHIPEQTEAQLVLAGPDPAGVADDPEAAAVFAQVESAWRGLPPATQSLVHLVGLPMEDADENAVIVNALQRRADVAVQKSLAEGFGLTVSEAMWKARPLVASRVGGIQDQVVHGESGLLIDDPRDLEAFASALISLLNDPDRGRRLGEGARRRVARSFLAPRQLLDHFQLLSGLIG